MNRRPSRPVQRTLAIRRSAGRWLIATFLLVFGAAALASVPVSSSLELKEHARSTTDLQRLANPQREARGIVEALLPRGTGGGKDFLIVRAVETAEAAFAFAMPSVFVRGSERLPLRSFFARAPPALMA